VPANLDKILRAGEGKISRGSRRSRGSSTPRGRLRRDVDAELREQTEDFKRRHADGETLDYPAARGLRDGREAAKRTLGQRHYDVQLMGGRPCTSATSPRCARARARRSSARCPAYLNALTGKGVHIVTVNDYLAERDSEWMGRVHRFLGLTVGVILANQKPDERRRQYECDITYGTNNEFGFDYLRDNMAWTQDDLVQRGHNYAIVDEVDSILIDEARTPLIISGPADQATKWYEEFARLVPTLKRGEVDTGEGDYEVDEKKRTVGIMESGVEKVEDYLGIDNLYDSVNTPLVGYLQNALKAKELFKKDKDYVVMNGEVLIVDEHTGRILAGRRYSEGMHQAIEAKEGVAIKDENQTLATDHAAELLPALRQARPA
jgi:preprotein translocase subunit SecA